jgi:hypothetical protein
VRSTPAGAEVLIDGQVEGKTPFERRLFDPTRPYALTVRKSGYETHEQMLSASDEWVKKGNKRTLTVPVKLSKSKGGATEGEGTGDKPAEPAPVENRPPRRSPAIMTSARLIWVAGAVAVLAGCHSASAAPDAGPRLPRLDVHMHVGPEGIDRLIKLMDRWGIDGAVNLSGMYPGPPRHMLETQLQAAKKAGGRLAVFANVDFRLVMKVPDLRQGHAAQLAEAKKLGAVGLKIPKGLGLGYPRADGQDLLPVDDPGPGSAVREGGRAGHAGGRSTPAIPRPSGNRPTRQRALGRAAGPPRVVVPRRGGQGHPLAVLGGAVQGLRAAGGPSPRDQLHRRPLRQRSGGSRTRWPACWTSTPTSTSTPRAGPEIGRHDARRCGASTSSTRTECSSARTRAWGRARTR